MPIKKETYICDSIRKLIDLNGDLVNFNIEFTITSKEPEEFYICIVDQNTLNTKKELEYKKVKNSISGSVTQDKNVYQNYFLVLKADKPTEVDVELKIETIEAKDTTPSPPYSQEFSHPHALTIPKPSEKKPLPWLKIMIFVGVVAVAGGLAYYFLVYKKKKAKQSFMTFNNTPFQKQELSLSSRDKQELVEEVKNAVKESTKSSPPSTKDTTERSPKGSRGRDKKGSEKGESEKKSVKGKTRKIDSESTSRSKSEESSKTISENSSVSSSPVKPKNPVYKPYDTKKDMLSKLRGFNR